MQFGKAFDGEGGCLKWRGAWGSSEDHLLISKSHFGFFVPWCMPAMYEGYEYDRIDRSSVGSSLRRGWPLFSSSSEARIPLQRISRLESYRAASTFADSLRDRDDPGDPLLFFRRPVFSCLYLLVPTFTFFFSVAQDIASSSSRRNSSVKTGSGSGSICAATMLMSRSEHSQMQGTEG